MPPCIPQLDFLPAVVVFQLLSLGLHQDDPPTLGHHNEVRVVIDEAVDAKSLSGNISMPPLDIGQGGKLPDQRRFQLIHVAFFRLVQRAAVDVCVGRGMDVQGEFIRRLTDDPLSLQPAFKGVLVVLGQ